MKKNEKFDTRNLKNLIFVYQIFNMDTSYRFTSDTEPSLKQLNDLMTEVIKDVKFRSKTAELKIKAIQKKYLDEVTRHQLSKQKK